MGQKIKKLQLFQFFGGKLGKFRSTELYGTALEGSTIFFVAALWGVRQWKAVN